MFYCAPYHQPVTPRDKYTIQGKFGQLQEGILDMMDEKISFAKGGSKSTKGKPLVKISQECQIPCQRPPLVR